jgi:hypothetical protein
VNTKTANAKGGEFRVAARVSQVQRQSSAMIGRNWRPGMQQSY